METSFIKKILIGIEDAVKLNLAVSYLTDLGFNIKTKKDKESVRHYGYDNSDNYIEVIYIKGFYYIIYSLLGQNKAISVNSGQYELEERIYTQVTTYPSNPHSVSIRGVITNSHHSDIFNTYKTLLNSFELRYGIRTIAEEKLLTTQNLFFYSYILNRKNTISFDKYSAKLDYVNLRDMILSKYIDKKNILDVDGYEKRRLITRFIKKTIKALITHNNRFYGVYNEYQSSNQELFFEDSPLFDLFLRPSNFLYTFLDSSLAKRYNGSFHDVVKFCQAEVFPKVLDIFFESNKLSKKLDCPSNVDYRMISYSVEKFRTIIDNKNKNLDLFLELSKMNKNGKPCSYKHFGKVAFAKSGRYSEKSPFDKGSGHIVPEYSKPLKDFFRISTTELFYLELSLLGDFINLYKHEDFCKNFSENAITSNNNQGELFLEMSIRANTMARYKLMNKKNQVQSCPPF